MYSSRGRAVVSGGHMNSSDGSNTGLVRTAASNLSALKSMNHNLRRRCDSMGARHKLRSKLGFAIAYLGYNKTACQLRFILKDGPAYIFTVHPETDCDILRLPKSRCLQSDIPSLVVNDKHEESMFVSLQLFRLVERRT